MAARYVMALQMAEDQGGYVASILSRRAGLLGLMWDLDDPSRDQARLSLRRGRPEGRPPADRRSLADDQVREARGRLAGHRRRGSGAATTTAASTAAAAVTGGDGDGCAGRCARESFGPLEHPGPKRAGWVHACLV